ncbi:MAG: ABC transporter permease subunit [bacterium]
MFFGKNSETTIYIIVIAAALPIISATWDGVKAANTTFGRSSQFVESPKTISFWNAIFPASLPCVFAGIRIGLARARTAVVVGEALTKATSGLGYVIFETSEELDFAYMLVSILTISLLALLIERLIIRTAEKAAAKKWGRMELKIANPGYTLY